jgi:hypothetical protein
MSHLSSSNREALKCDRLCVKVRALPLVFSLPPPSLPLDDPRHRLRADDGGIFNGTTAIQVARKRTSELSEE